MRPALSEALFPLSSLDGLFVRVRMRLVQPLFSSAQPARRRGTVAVLLLLAVFGPGVSIRLFPTGLLGVRSLLLSDSWLMFLVSKEGLVVIRRLEFRCVFKT